MPQEVLVKKSAGLLALQLENGTLITDDFQTFPSTDAIVEWRVDPASAIAQITVSPGHPPDNFNQVNVAPIGGATQPSLDLPNPMDDEDIFIVAFDSSGSLMRKVRVIRV